MAFKIGQRWINTAELELGLGTVIDVDQRTVTIEFISTGDIRIFAAQHSPLARVIFNEGDQIEFNGEQILTVDEVHQENDLLFYAGTDQQGNELVAPEGWLNHNIQMNRPAERLFSGQVDQNKFFNLRLQSWRNQMRHHNSPMRGLTGSRTSLIPHQLYIANEVASRFAPRVLLADEVGLGKTIEAGLILNYQLLTGRAQRVLIVVPESLLHQWLVEMLRRFNLHFSLFNEERCAPADPDEFDEVAEENPFSGAQLVLCSLDFLRDNPKHQQQALEAGWDLMVVDEAHHLAWSETEISAEYALVERFAQAISGVLLLTATPEQLGKQSHFARLRLLDPDRFNNFEQFLLEEQSYQPIADTVEALMAEGELPAEAVAIINQTLNEQDNLNYLSRVQKNPADQEARQALIQHLLDRHGTGRILFRNTRAAVKGFPQRRLNAYPLPTPEQYSIEQLHQPLPERSLAAEGEWCQFDPRVDWLIQHLKQYRTEKQLVIAASAETALELAEILMVKQGIHAAVFHEGMTIIERDRAAAYFADSEYGSPLLICSEIGSEGRNFQFAHHIVMFDLPENPDLLEQRIGRLDRIGQTRDIQIHVPYIQNSAQAVLFDWYHQGLHIFEHPCPAGHMIYAQVAPQLRQCFSNSEKLEELITTTSDLYQRMTEALQKGRDRLLEYNSCRREIALQLTEQATARDNETGLADYMDAIFDCFGVESEHHSEHSLILRPSPNMSEPFPDLSDDGTTITYDRDTALSYEDRLFLTWDHSMVTSAMEMVLNSEMGNTALITIPSAPLKQLKIDAGSILLEVLFVLDAPQPIRRFLPTSTFRVVLGENHNNWAGVLKPSILNQMQTTVKRTVAGQIINAKRDVIQGLIDHSKQLAAEQNSAITDKAHQQAAQLLNKEIHRLTALKTINPSVRDSEIAHYQQQLTTVQQHIDDVSLRLDALRVIFTT